MSAKLTDAAQRACWKRMAERPFAKAELVSCAEAAGQPKVRAYSAVSGFLNDLKARGAVFYSGPPNGGRWKLLPKDQWTGAPIPKETPKPVLQAPADGGPYDPAPEIEGRNNGLTTALGEHLWHDLGGGDRSNALSSLPVMEQRAWREAAGRALDWLFDKGFVGPAGPPRERFTGWSYKWLYEANCWEICDDEGGYVAMIANDADAPLFLAAPDMATAIRQALSNYDEKGAISRADIPALRASLPVEPTLEPGRVSGAPA
jgi:hypothetical protein